MKYLYFAMYNDCIVNFYLKSSFKSSYNSFGSAPLPTPFLFWKNNLCYRIVTEGWVLDIPGLCFQTCVFILPCVSFRYVFVIRMRKSVIALSSSKSLLSASKFVHLLCHLPVGPTKP